MSEINFAMFCITIIALAAIAREKDQIAEKALSTLNGTTKGIMSLVERLIEHFRETVGNNRAPRR